MTDQASPIESIPLPRVNLYAHDKQVQPRHDGWVASPKVPAFTKEPEIIVWGERVFIRRENGRYTEADGCWAVPPVLVEESLKNREKATSGRFPRHPAEG